MRWLFAIVVVACSNSERPREPPASVEPVVDASALLAKFECWRCHGDRVAAPLDKQCVGCHQAIHAGTFDATPNQLARWRSRIVSLRWAPSLATADRLRRAWVREFLLSPHDVRPGLPAEMPRLAMTADEADQLAAYLVPHELPACNAPHTVPARDAQHVVPARDAPRALPACDAQHVVPARDAPRTLPARDAPRTLPARDAPHALATCDAPYALATRDTPHALPTRDAPNAIPARDAPHVVAPCDAPRTLPAPDIITRGEERYRALACGRCHRFTGARVDNASLHAAGQGQVDPLAGSWALAPDLRHTRARMELAQIEAWIVRPRGAMPDQHIAPADARALAAFIVATPLAAPPPRRPIKRLPILARDVTWDEVEARVFRKVCWHCHSQPEYTRGDGGPGNTGGFGFAPRGLDVSSYAAISSGALDDAGEPRSVFAKRADGTPRIIATLLARHVEEAGGTVEGVRGMPLGLPALPLEDIQLVDTWIAQGRPR